MDRREFMKFFYFYYWIYELLVDCRFFWEWCGCCMINGLVVGFNFDFILDISVV